MRIEKLTFIAILPFILKGLSIHAQEQVSPSPVNLCSTHEVMEVYYMNNPEAKAEQDEREIFTRQFVQAVKAANAGANTQKNVLPKYRIPVVCHVYGNNFWGKTLTDQQIQDAINEATKDFQALNADFSTVNNNFSSLKSGIDLSFELAKKDPNGNPTNGIDRKTTTGAGYGNANGYDSKIAADAWNCKMYFNIYIVADIYNNGVNNNSGVCWYPDVAMTNANTARCVFNGQYIGTNSTNAEFRAVLTHEFGHFMNLIHTFEGGCTGSGDNVSDTPVHSSTTLGCPTSQTSNTPISDCGNWVINSENYMDYNGASCGYKNFTKGQVARMEAALNKNDVTRFPLWQTSNLIATGLLDPTEVNTINDAVYVQQLYPNPSVGMVNLELDIRHADQYRIEVSNTLGQVVYCKILPDVSGAFKTTIDLQNQSKGLYFISISASTGKRVLKLIKE